MIKRFAVHLVAWALITVAAAPRITRATANPELDKSAETAVFLLQMSMRVHRNGQHHALLRALRQLHNPALQPLFSTLAESSHPDLQMHGVLGLAESSSRKQIDLARVADVTSPQIQVQLISHAMDNELLTIDQTKEILAWKDADEAVKVLAAARLIQEKQFDDPAILQTASESDNAARRCLVALLLLQCGEDSALEQLDQADQSTGPQRDAVRQMLLRSALRFKLDRTGPWALKIASDPEAVRQTHLLALRAALQFDVPGAFDLWHRHFASAADATAQTRMATIAISLAPDIPAELIDPMLQNNQPLIRQIGQCAAAISSGSGIADHIGTLMKMGHSIVNQWALWYARRHASDADCQRILSELIGAFNEADPTKALRLDHVASATQLFVERYPDTSIGELRSTLVSQTTPARLKRIILLGLIGCRDGSGAHKVVADLEPFDDPVLRRLSLLLIAKHSDGLNDDQLDKLGLLVRGGGLQGPLRIQAAWRYLRLTNRIDAAMKRVLGQ